MTLLSILQSVLPAKKDSCECHKLDRFHPHYVSIVSYNKAISDLTDRLSKAEFLIEEDKATDAMIMYVLENKITSLKVLTRDDFKHCAKAIISTLPSLLSVVEKNAKGEL